jgi:putative ATP-binding cassette transporter
LKHSLVFLLQYARDVKSFKAIAALAVISGAIGGLAVTGLLALFNAVLNDSINPSAGLVLGFFALCFLMPLIRLGSEMMIIHLSVQVTYDLRMNLCRRILSAPLRGLEEIGTARLMATLTDDIAAISMTLTSVPALCINAAIVTGCLIYLAWLSRTVFIAVVIFTTLGTVIYQLLVGRAMRYQKLARENWDNIIEHFQTLTGGIKELRLHRLRGREYYESFESTASNLRRFNSKWMTVFSAAGQFSEMLVFILIGLLVFVLPNINGFDSKSLAGCCLTILYMLGPLGVVINMIPSLSRANIAIMKIQKLDLSLGTQSIEDNSSPLPGPQWKRLELVNVTHSYRQKDDNGDFTLGPLTLTLLPGEMVFVTGGNGSGKTTLIKLITGLYAPDSGEIRLDGETITERNRDDYRQLFSVVFSDFYLFKSLFGLDSENVALAASDYLVKLKLDEKVEIRDRMFSTIDLSHGQRRRLALLTAYMENREIWVLDEWAADQDPIFRDIFYHEILPELKAKGKTLIVITHDDRYYELANRIIKLDYGKIVSCH